MNSSLRICFAVSGVTAGHDSDKEDANMDATGDRPPENIIEARLRLIIVLMLFAASVLAWLLLRNEGGAGDAELRVLSIRDTFPIALELARGWCEDAVLNSAEMPFGPVDQVSDLTGYFAFRSPSRPRAWLTVYVTETTGGGTVSAREEGDYEGEEPPPLGDAIDPLQLPIDSAEALELVMQNGGRDYLGEHQGVAWPVYLGLRYRDLYQSQGGLIWIALFGDRRGNISIDARSGELVD